MENLQFINFLKSNLNSEDKLKYTDYYHNPKNGYISPEARKKARLKRKKKK